MKTKALALLVANMALVGCGPNSLPNLQSTNGVKYFWGEDVKPSHWWNVEHLSRLEKAYVAHLQKQTGMYEDALKALDGAEVTLVPDYFPCLAKGGECEGYDTGDFITVTDAYPCPEMGPLAHEWAHLFLWKLYGVVDSDHTKPIWKTNRTKQCVRDNEEFIFDRNGT